MAQGRADAAQGSADPCLALSESIGDFAGRLGSCILVFKQPALLFGEAVEAFFEKINEGKLGRKVSPHGLLHEVVLKKFVMIFGESLVAQSLLPNQIERDRPKPFPGNRFPL